MKRLFEIFNILNTQQKKNFWWVTFYKLIEAILEVVSIGAIYPLIYIIFNDDLPFLNQFSFINTEKKSELFVIVLTSLILVFVVKALYAIFSSYKSNSFLVKLTKTTQIKLLKKYLDQDYLFFLNKKSEKLLNNIISESVHFSKSQVMPIYALMNEFVKIFFIFFLILFINPFFTLLSILIFAPIILIFLKKVKKELSILGNIRQHNSENMIKFATNGFNSIREILIFKNQRLFLDKFIEHCRILNATSLKKNLWQDVPKIILEFSVVFYILSVFIIAFKFTSYSLEEIFIFLSFLSISFVRLLPSTNRSISMMQDLSFYYNVTKIIKKSYKLQGTKKISHTNKKTLDFRNLIIKNLNYSFKNKKIFDNLSLKIKSNLVYGVNGQSGSGKTTLFNLLIGFLEPNKGNIFIDGEKIQSIKDLWQDNLCYIPQDLYLLEDTIEKNITLSDNESDKVKLLRSIDHSKLNTLVAGYSKKIKHIIKNAGIDLSGGQRQRLGIARSIYMNRNVVFLDETTNALDKSTEHEILSDLKKSLKNKTIFVISHNKNLHRYVDKIITIRDKKVTIKNARH
jgi:ATP-binding cassette, subfamily B, bacterial PglK